jgi:hypothetical protein
MWRSGYARKLPTSIPTATATTSVDRSRTHLATQLFDLIPRIGPLSATDGGSLSVNPYESSTRVMPLVGDPTPPAAFTVSAASKARRPDGKNPADLVSSRPVIHAGFEGAESVLERLENRRQRESLATES